LNDWIDIGVFGKEKRGGKEEETVLYLQKHRLSQPKWLDNAVTVEIVVS
jgi:hypothetical protein